MKIEAVVIFEIPEFVEKEFDFTFNGLENDLLGEVVKVKTGIYENQLMGEICLVRKIEEKKATPRKPSNRVRND